MYFEIRRRSTGKIVKHLGTFATREEAKPDRDNMNKKHYVPADVPMHNREYYVARTKWHRNGPSK